MHATQTARSNATQLADTVVMNLHARAGHPEQALAGHGSLLQQQLVLVLAASCQKQPRI